MASLTNIIQNLHLKDEGNVAASEHYTFLWLSCKLCKTIFLIVIKDHSIKQRKE